MAEPIPPIIVAGMHRSGTTLLSTILQQSGLFMGDRQDLHGEAFLFLRLNEWILNQAHCHWDNVSRYEAMDDFTREQAIRVVRRHLSGARRFSFLGPIRFFRYSDITTLDIPWGWKDPRNTITMDIWKQIFPNAKIIHVFRHPVDVAQSLRKREEHSRRIFFGLPKRSHNAIYFKARLRWKEFRLSPGGWYSYMPATPSLYSRSCSALESGFQIWKDYAIRALELGHRFPGDVTHIRFESFLENPREGLDHILGFAGLAIDDATRERILGGMNPGRKFAFSNDPELVRFLRSIQDDPLLRQTGYLPQGTL